MQGRPLLDIRTVLLVGAIHGTPSKYLQDLSVTPHGSLHARKIHFLHHHSLVFL